MNKLTQRVGISGVGIYLPERIMTNQEMEAFVDTSDEWISSRTGIRERRIAEPTDCASDLAVRASQQALKNAGLEPKDLDLIICTSITTDYQWPATACLVQAELGALQAAAFDLSAGCSGLVYAMTVGAQMIASGLYRRVLVIGAETMSRILDWKDRRTCVLFGDGASAVILEPVENGGFLAFDLGADGRGIELLYQPAGGCKTPITAEVLEKGEQFLAMNGREVFKFAVRVMSDTVHKTLAEAELSLEDIDFFIPHQANIRIIDAAAKKLGLPMDKVFANVDKYGNTSSASVGIALYEALQAGKIKKGDHVVLVGFGAGLTWASTVIQWN